MNRSVCWHVVEIGVLIQAVLNDTVLWAAESQGSSWRDTYDPIMKWVNFAILLFVIVKYAGPPLVNFLRAQGRDIEREMTRIEKQKAEMLYHLKQVQKQLSQSDTRMTEIRQRIIDEGKRRKAAIIREAEEESRRLIESAGKKAQAHLLEAKRKLQEELIDLAADRALQTLPKVVRTEDRERMIASYLDQIR
ncbi:MAG: ATP synthase F0 subunit B [Thermodesulfobacteriota bacterium]